MRNFQIAARISASGDGGANTFSLQLVRSAILIIGSGISAISMLASDDTGEIESLTDETYFGISYDAIYKRNELAVLFRAYVALISPLAARRLATLRDAS